MRPAVVLLGFALGSAAAISFALAGTTIVFLTLRREYPHLEGELRPLLISVGLFSLLTVAAGTSFYGELKERRWRRAALAALFVMLVALAAYFASPGLFRD